MLAGGRARLAIGVVVSVRRKTEADPALRLELNALLRYGARMSELPLLDQSASRVFSSLLRENADAAVRALEAALATRYAIIRPLGAGGVATVYLVNDLRVNRQVAIKVLRADLSQTVGAERFAREVQLVATFEHPHIVGALDSGEADGHFWCHAVHRRGVVAATPDPRRRTAS